MSETRESYYVEGPLQMKQFNKMGDSGFCECGGKYEHVDETRPTGDDIEVLDSYQCNKCETWCIVVWHKDTEEEIRREYEE